jgi:tetratricopeptide (TPR) repeat protein
LAFDRESALKKAEKLLRQGRLDAAIAEYGKVVEDQPRDWNSANALGDLYARAGQVEKAVAQFSRIAEHLASDGFYPKAAALYKKILKLRRDDEDVQLQLAEISALQGLLADAKTSFNAVAERRRSRGDRRGEAEILVRLADIDPSDIEARMLAARTLERLGRTDEAAARFKALAADLREKGRDAQAMDALRELARLRPDDGAARASLARAALSAGDVTGALQFLDREAAGTDPDLLLALLDVHLREGDAAAVTDVAHAIAADPAARRRMLDAAWSIVDRDPPTAFACLDCAVDAALAAGAFHDAATLLQDFGRRVPGHIPSLLKLVEVCVDGGFEADMYAAQEQLTDAYLAAGQAAEARVIAEDLVAREPWEAAHINRFRRALVMLRVPDPDGEIAERLSGQSPFTATDHFVDLGEEPSATAGTGERDTGADGEPEASPAPAPPYEAADGGEPDVPEPCPEARAADEIDLSGALGRLDAGRSDQHANAPGADQAADLERVFEGLREEAQAAGDYSAQHMTLARTYLEMGMADEAIPSLRTAARSPRLRFEAASRLARLLMARNERDEALEWFERAAEAPPPTAEEGRELLYDFGVALDEAGETPRALAIFLELQADAGDYRDVPSRIDRLARAQTGG